MVHSQGLRDGGKGFWEILFGNASIDALRSLDEEAAQRYLRSATGGFVRRNLFDGTTGILNLLVGECGFSKAMASYASSSRAETSHSTNKNYRIWLTLPPLMT